MHAAHQMAGFARQVWLLPHGAQYRLAMPKDEPGRQNEEGGGAQRLVDGAAHVAHRMAATAAFAGDQRRGGGDEAKAEDQQRVEQVDRQRPGGDRFRAQPAHEQQIGRGDPRPGDIARDHGNSERDERARLDAPGGRLGHVDRPGWGSAGKGAGAPLNRLSAS